jgi:peptidoglycan hydrolase CwlO-like protein
MSDSERLEKLIESNAKSIQALTDLANKILPRLDDMQRQIFNIQRQMIDNQRRIDDNTADIRELTLENQRILKYLESRNQ